MKSLVNLDDYLIVDKKRDRHYMLDDDTKQIRQERRAHIKQTYTNLCFEGGGIKGFAYSGTLFFLEEYGMTSEIKNVIGSSVGAITAMLFALGLSAYDIFREMIAFDFEKFQDGDFGFIRDVKRIFTKFGMYKGSALQAAIEEVLNRHVGNSEITFEQLYQKTGINLVVTGTDMESMQTVYFHRGNQNYPNMKVKIAVRISAAAPIVYQYVSYHKKKYADGGLFANLPMAFFDQQQKNGSYIKNPATLGLMVTEDLQSKKAGTMKYDNSNVFKYTLNIISALVDKASETQFQGELNQDGSYQRIIDIETGNIDTFKFDLSEKEMEFLFENGYKSAAAFFKIQDSLDLVFDEVKCLHETCPFDTIHVHNERLRLKYNSTIGLPDLKNRKIKKSGCCCTLI